VEVAPQKVQQRPGVVKAGIGEKLNDGLRKAQSTLESAVERSSTAAPAHLCVRGPQR